MPCRQFCVPDRGVQLSRRRVFMLVRRNPRIGGLQHVGGFQVGRALPGAGVHIQLVVMGCALWTFGALYARSISAQSSRTSRYFGG